MLGVSVVRWRCEQLKALPRLGHKAPTPVIDAMFSRDEPRTGPSGTLAWSVDVENPATGENFTLTLKEVTLPGPDGATVTRPCAVGFSGNYPRAMDGLARILSLDMRVIDPAWIGMKLRKLLNYAEPLGHFMAFVPGLPHGQQRQQVWPSTVAYMARLIIHRYAMLGVLDEQGFPLREMGVLESPTKSAASPEIAGARCPDDRQRGECLDGESRSLARHQGILGVRPQRLQKGRAAPLPERRIERGQIHCHQRQRPPQGDQVDAEHGPADSQRRDPQHRERTEMPLGGRDRGQGERRASGTAIALRAEGEHIPLKQPRCERQRRWQSDWTQAQARYHAVFHQVPELPQLPVDASFSSSAHRPPCKMIKNSTSRKKISRPTAIFSCRPREPLTKARRRST